MKIILIEDDKKKIDDIKSFLQTNYDFHELMVKESYQSGLRELLKNKYDLLLLDMSVPTWDKSIDEPGGNFEKFGGIKILKEITRKKKAVDTILITMFDDFGESDNSITLSQIDQALTDEFPSFYKGAVYYNTREDKWKTDLNTFIEQYKNFMNILIVDDNNDKIAKIVSVIKGASDRIDVDTASDSISAQVKLQRKKYDLLLLDLLLPLRIGQEPLPNGGVLLLKEINRSDKIKSPTIITGITQYEEYQEGFSSIWKLLLFKNDDWPDDLKKIIKHLQKSIKYQSNPISIKPSVIVEGETDAAILTECFKLFQPSYLEKIDIKSQKSGGANWVANQVIAWAHLHHKNQDGSLIKCLGLLDGDQAGKGAYNDIKRVIKANSTGDLSFKIITLSPGYAQDIKPLYKRGLAIPTTLEELYPISFWLQASNNNWLERRSSLDKILKNPGAWDKMTQSLGDYLDSLLLKDEEKIYLNTFTMKGKEKSVKYIQNLEDEDKKTTLCNFEKLVNDIIDCLF